VTRFNCVCRLRSERTFYQERSHIFREKLQEKEGKLVRLQTRFTAVKGELTELRKEKTAGAVGGDGSSRGGETGSEGKRGRPGEQNTLQLQLQLQLQQQQGDEESPRVKKARRSDEGGGDDGGDGDGYKTPDLGDNGEDEREVPGAPA
jgi:hypothetical protein